MPKGTNLLLVEDSIEDITLILAVFEEEKIAVNIKVARDGEEAMKLLLESDQIDLILLDLNLPKKDGREVLLEMKSIPRLRSIPVVILTTSEAEEDILRSYQLQASCYVTKPINFDQFVKIVKSIDDFWFSAVRFPPRQ
ncbi:MAG: response regulator [Candidatus Obscuribacterales bacterium]|jgi:two-component system response regulator|nr:response regulator [Candidatus Obscuribacterales bacterium]